MIKIITDSSSLYTVEKASDLGIDSIPLCISIGENHWRDLQVDMNEFYRLIKAGGIPTSSQPPIGDVIDTYESHVGDVMINIAMADGLSGTYQTACSAKEMVEHKDSIEVFNSQTLCGPHHYMVTQAKKMADEGATKEQIMDYLETAKVNTESFLIPQNFAFLRRGGRLTPLAATIGSILKLKPVVKLTQDGKRLDKFCTGRTISAVGKSIVRYLQEKALGIEHILYISHADALEDAKKIKSMMEEAFSQLEIRILELSPAFVTQGGPQCIAIQYIKRS